MTVTIEIPDDVEKQIQENVVRGDIEAAHHVLLEAVFPTVEAAIMDSTAPATMSYEEFEAMGKKLVDMFEEYIDPDCPPLSDYAVSREGIYEGRPKL